MTVPIFNPNRKEIDLRLELDNTLYGSVSEIAKRYHVLVRYMRQDDQGRFLNCPACNHMGEGSSAPQCPVCEGEGRLWDEKWEICFKQEVGSESSKARRSHLEGFGNVKGQLTRFYFEDTVDLLVQDRIVEVKTDNDGNPIVPYRRQDVWQIQDIERRRSDQGRIEFVVAYCSKLTHFETNYTRRRHAYDNT